jgi:hypothetical protein
MTSPAETQTAPTPTVRQLARTTVIALMVAAVILVTIVLPAEYAIDPLGMGGRLGLTDIAAPPLREIAADVRPARAALKPAARGPLGEYPADYKLDVFEITLQPYDYVEYKYHLEQGATMLYSWKASAPLMQDFHGERATRGSDGEPEEESFDKQDRRQASGSLVAPFAGIHGWYWENPSGTPITIRLTSAGFFGSAIEIRSDRTRHQRILRTLDVLTPRPAEPTGTNSR